MATTIPASEGSVVASSKTSRLKSNGPDNSRHRHPTSATIGSPAPNGGPSELTASVATIPSVATSTSVTCVTRLRSYKSTSSNKWVTKEIAALEFLLEIPMEAEGRIVQEGWLKQEQGRHHEKRHKRSDSHSQDSLVIMTAMEEGEHTSTIRTNQLPILIRQGRWWEKWITTSVQQEIEQLQHGNTIQLDRDSRIEDLDGPQDADKVPEWTDVNGTSAHGESKQQGQQQRQLVPTAIAQAPGRRLEGDEAITVQIPLTVDTAVQTRQRTIALLARTREWEMQVAHGIVTSSKSASSSSENRHRRSEESKQVPLLDGRLFFSAKESYPIHVFSLIRYEPRREEAARRRQKLEERGGGGTQFFTLPSRDWRGISYRALLPSKDNHRFKRYKDGLLAQIQNHGHLNQMGSQQRKRMEKASALIFDRFASRGSEAVETPAKERKGDVEKDLISTPQQFDEETDDDEDYSDDDDDPYVAGLLDDPHMVLGRHRNVMFGDRGTGPIVSSTIQFVKPQLLKAELNKQFRDRFDGYEPPESQRKFIGARVIDGMYTLIDPAEDNGVVVNADEDSTVGTTTTSPSNGTSTVPAHRTRQESVSSFSSTHGGGGGVVDGKDTIRMPPSLTLSKIRSLKNQALMAAIKAKLEMSTVALAIVYFERLCLDCRVDKSNRRLSFAACLLIAVKINEDLKALGKQEKVDSPTSENKRRKTSIRFQSLIRPTKKVDSLFASLLAFFTQDWHISLKHLYAAEWGVFAALQFRLSAKPSHVAFHFKLLVKSLGWDPRRYLGPQMYGYWQEALIDEELTRKERDERREKRIQRKEKKKLLQLERELEAANRKEKSSRSSVTSGEDDPTPKEVMVEEDVLTKKGSSLDEPNKPNRRRGSRHGLGDIFKLPIGSNRAHSAERKRTSSTELGTPHQKVIPFEPTTGHEIRLATESPTRRPPLSPQIRPLSKSASMYASTSMEREMLGSEFVVKNEKV